LGASEVLVAGNDPDEMRMAERLGELCELCARHGLTPSVEPMPWTDVRDYAQGLRLLDRAATAANANAGILVDPIHFDRGLSRPEEITATPPARLRYAQLCDAPAERPADRATLLHQARAERLMPGDGGLDLRGLLRALPADIPLALEVPMHTLARTVPALERARRMLAKTRQLLETVRSSQAQSA
jgi:sugar phosphate isomerase/epimerase